MRTMTLFFIGAMALGCSEVQQGGTALPSPYYLEDDVQYFPGATKREQSINAWKSKRASAELTRIEEEDTSPIKLEMKLADSHEQWSTATGRRVLKEDTDLDTLRISLSSFVSDLEWDPVTDAYSMFALGDTDSGKTDLFEWEFTDESTETEQILAVRFRMPPEENE